MIPTKKRSIRFKVVMLVLIVSGIVLGTLCISMLFTMNTMRNSAVHTNQTLGSMAAKDAKTALSEQAKQNISELARSKADYIEQRFNITETYDSQIADEMTRIYGNSAAYPDRNVAEPVKENAGVLKAQLMYSAIVKDQASVSEELAKAANIQDLLYQVVNHDKMIGASYIATKSGLVIMADINSLS
ncbi:MAG TPA: hypothetical protein VHR42_06875 [Clostridia bacterium]|nr:hypothetical protein [Clostridia bacterium]